MIEVLTLVNFDNPKRVEYLEKSFGSFYRHYKNVRHVVMDGSKNIDLQLPIYRNYGVEVYHRPESTYGDRLKMAMELIKEKYFLFLPDDFQWIFPFPLEDAMVECSQYKIAEMKLTCRGLNWFSNPGADPEPWFSGNKVMSGETLNKVGSLAVSKRWLFRNFHEQFSLACNVLEAEFARWVIGKISRNVRTPGEAEKQAYIWLVFRRYRVAYYKMWIPAFHFIDLNVEGSSDKNLQKAATMLIKENFETYNRCYNQ